MPLLPPCKSSLRKHSSHVNYVVQMWRQKFNSTMTLWKIAVHGWLDDGLIDWTDLPYPVKIVELLPRVDEENSAQEKTSKWGGDDLSYYESDSDC